MSELTIISKKHIKLLDIIISILLIITTARYLSTLPIGLIWKIIIGLSITLLLGIVLRSSQQTVTFYPKEGYISIKKRNKSARFPIDSFIGSASGWLLKSQYQYGYRIVMIPKDKQTPALIVYQDKQHFNKKYPDPEKIALLRQQIAQTTQLIDYGFLGLISSDEWRYLAMNPEKPDMYGNYWKKEPK